MWREIDIDDIEAVKANGIFRQNTSKWTFPANAPMGESEKILEMAWTRIFSE